MFETLMVDYFPGFFSVRNSNHEIVYLNKNFKEWINRYTQIDPIGKTNIEIASICDKQVADVFLQCHDYSIELQKKSDQIEPLKKVIIFEDVFEKTQKNKYFDTLKYKISIDGEFYIFTISYDVTEMFSNLLESYKNHSQELEDIVFIDKITGGFTLEKFKIEADRILKSNQKKLYSILKIDISGFKLINDQFGFDIGNNIIKIMSNSMYSLLKYDDEIFARVNADEYLILLNYFSLEEQDKRYNLYLNFLNNLLKNYNFKFRFPTGRYIFLSDYYDDNESNNIISIIEKVNFAHRKAKANLIDSLVDYNEDIKIQIIREKNIENNMEYALENKEFKLFLQPKYIIDNEKIGGAEALVRWKPLNSNIIYPNEFIHIFEKNGFIKKLDMYMLEEVCIQIKEWIRAGIKPIKISVNFSRLHLINKNFVEDICKICKKYDVDKKYIEIELTESIMVDNEVVLNEIIKKIRKEGFTISMDDFGTGYSSLSLLKNISVDAIKIDRSFFIMAHDDEKTKTILKNVFNLAKDLAIYTVAEGVEESIHVDMLKAMGCDMIQGYFYYKPMPSVELSKLL